MAMQAMSEVASYSMGIYLNVRAAKKWTSSSQSPYVGFDLRENILSRTIDHSR